MANEWEENLMRICDETETEFIRDNRGILLISPQKLTEETKKKIRGLVPIEMALHFEEGPRISTLTALKILFTNLSAHADMRIKERSVFIDITDEKEVFGEQAEGAFGIIQHILKSDPFVQGWTITLNNTIVKEYDMNKEEMIKKAVESKKTSGDRDNCPTQDEILNLKIALAVNQDVNDFINSL